MTSSSVNSRTFADNGEAVIGGQQRHSLGFKHVEWH